MFVWEEEEEEKYGTDVVYIKMFYVWTWESLDENKGQDLERPRDAEKWEGEKIRILIFPSSS